MAIVLRSTVHLTQGLGTYTEPSLTPESDASEKCLLTDEMALQAAMALSGLSPGNFDGSLSRFYQQGAILLKSPSTASVGSSESEIISQESGISSLSGQSAVRRNLGPYFDMLTAAELEHQNAVDENIRVTPDSPFLDISSEKSISNNNTTNNNNNSNIDNNEDKKIIYQGRDILDLYNNISKPFDLVIGDIGTGSKSFFENRSLFSRAAGVHLPAHLTTQCECDYIEYSYF